MTLACPVQSCLGLQSRAPSDIQPGARRRPFRQVTLALVSLEICCVLVYAPSTNAAGGAPQALLAGDDDLGVLGDLLLHGADEARVGLHVRAAQPPAAQAQVARLLQHQRRAPLLVHDVHRHLLRALHARLRARQAHATPSEHSAFPCGLLARPVLSWSSISKRRMPRTRQQPVAAGCTLAVSCGGRTSRKVQPSCTAPPAIRQCSVSSLLIKMHSQSATTAELTFIRSPAVFALMLFTLPSRICDNQDPVREASKSAGGSYSRPR